ncbi:MAG: DHH family phosphoesterase [Methanobrevibacter sp.]|jgi:RecJ-like exonuclease|nr:DHH family phosphoesterase [Candidatus Methanovirga basalitermitum]
MRSKCLKCNGKGSIVAKRKSCKACDGTGFENTFETKNHFKGINSSAKAKFDLESDSDIPCEVCNGTGKIDVHKKCEMCNGTGELNVCSRCGKSVNEDKDLCESCVKIVKKEEEKIKKEEEKINKILNEEQNVYVLDILSEIEDLKKGVSYKGKVSRVEKYGVFVSLNKDVWGLLREKNPKYKVSDEILVKVSQIKKDRREVDLQHSLIVGKYKLKTLKKNIARSKIASLENITIGKNIMVQGEVLQIQQTAGPTIFTITDETGITWVAAFDEAGTRAYPSIDLGDLVEVTGELNEHGGKTQIESSSIKVLDDKKSEEIKKLIERALDERAEVEDTDLLVESPILEKLKPKMIKAAKTIRRAILDGRSILIRHHADADGICAGIAVEKAVIPYLNEINPDKDAEWHYFKRAPSKAPFYELEDVVKDLSFALEDLERHGQKLPLIVLLDNGSTEEDILALMKAKIYGIEIVVIDHHFPGKVVDGKVEVDEFVDVHVNPYIVGGDSQITAGCLGFEVARMINPDVAELIKHLPGIAVIGDHADSNEAEEYIEIAIEKGYSKEDLRKIAECVDFEAYYLRFMNGRGIMDTILDVDNFDKHEKLLDALFKEYSKRVDIQLKAALPNLKECRLNNGLIFNVLDVEKYAHRFTFPAPGKTCGFVHDAIVKKYGEEEPILTLAHGPDFGVVRATESVNKKFGFNLNEVIWDLVEEIPEAGIDGGGHECAGSIKFIEGLSKEVLSSFSDKIAKLS